MSSLADKISGLLNTAPNYNPDVEIYEETAAKLTDIDLEEHIEEELVPSSLRKQNVDLLDDVEQRERYAGKKGSRKSFKESDDESFDNDHIEPIDQESDYSNEEESEDSDYSHGKDQTFSDNEKDDPHFKHISDNKCESTKGLNVRNQLCSWENLLEIRIQLQKCLSGCNRLPQGEVFKEMSSNGQFVTNIETLKNTLGSVLNKMLQFQELIINKYPETKKLLKRKVEVNEKEDSDEEIPSDSDIDEDNAEESAEEQTTVTGSGKPQKKKLKLPVFETEISKKHELYKTFRNATIQTWNEKTQVAQGKNADSFSVLSQIEHNLNDKDRLIKRTQLRRSEYRILGTEDNLSDESNQRREYNPEVFDDDGFYHQLLRELIEVKSADVTDPIQLSRQWIQLRNMRSKIKRKIDTRATKGRKIRYGVHTKLVNFMAPIDECKITDDARVELFNSLFGKKHK